MIAYTKYPFDGRVRLEAESLVSWGYEVVFLVPKEGSKPRDYTLEGVTVQELHVGKYSGKNQIRYVLGYLTFLALALIACTRLFFQRRIRVIHVHNMPDILVLAAIIPRLFGATLILDVHDTVPETYEAKFGRVSQLLLGLLRLEERICFSLAQRIICVNHVQRETVIRRGVSPDKVVTVISMPRTLPEPQSPQVHTQSNVFRMVNHGTISRRLGNDLILEAAAKLVKEIPGFELHFIGGGDNLDQVRALTKSLGLEDQVHFHKGVPFNELAKKLSIMDVGIVANRVNVATALMLPAKLIDYVTLGIPAIVPRLKAIEYYFSDDMVSYFEPENTDSIVAATLALYRDRAKRERQARNAKRFLDRYRWDKSEDGLRTLYHDLTQRSAPGA